MTLDDQVRRLPDGGVIGYAEFGDPNGRPLIALHGIPSCGLAFALLDEPARRLGVRVVAPDRAGIRSSSPRPGHGLVEIVDDVISLCDALELGPAALLGWSGGAAYTYAAARWRASAFTRIGVVAGTGSPEIPGRDRAYSLFDRVSFRLARWSPRVLADVLEVEVRALAAFSDRKPDHDRADDMRVLLAAFRTGARGVADDYRATCTDWGFRLADISAPVQIWHGTDDTLVEPWIARITAGRIPHASLDLVTGAGHDLIAGHAAEIVGALTTRR